MSFRLELRFHLELSADSVAHLSSLAHEGTERRRRVRSRRPGNHRHFLPERVGLDPGAQVLQLSGSLQLSASFAFRFFPSNHIGSDEWSQPVIYLLYYNPPPCKLREHPKSILSLPTWEVRRSTDLQM